MERVNDIDKAQAQTVYKLSRVIGCEMEDLLERPMEEALDIAGKVITCITIG